MKHALFAAVATSLVAACASTAPTASTGSAAPAAPAAAPLATRSTVVRAEVALSPASASLVSGKLTLMAMGSGVHLTGEIGGLAPGSVHAIHIHEKGDCSAADATSAGGHFNPAAQAHGRVGHGAHHGGDMDNITANGEGVATVNVHAQGVVLGGGAGNDVIGRAVIVHAAADDYVTQPTGNAGARVACGVVKVSP